MQNSVISSRNTSLHGSQTSPVFLCMQNNVISIRITSLYWSQPSSVIFACKTASFGSEWHFSMSPRLRLLTCECKIVCLDPEWRLSIGPSLNNSDFSIRINILYGSQSSFVAFLCKTETLRPELQVSVGPRPHLFFLHSKQRLYHKNCKSLLVPVIICRFVLAKQRD